MKTKKIEKDFLLSDSSVNVYGFRLLTEGYLIDEYKRNPIGYYMHDREKGVVVKWEDLRVVDGKVYGKPVINLSNERGQQIVDEIEGGFLNGASVGHIVALKFSEDPKDMLPGQTGPTITKWYNRECSLCDVPGNMNALALYDKDGNEIKLTDFKIQNINMEKIFLTAEQLTKLGLKADAKAADLETAITNLVAASAKVDDLTAQLATANTNLTAANAAKDTAVQALADYKKTNEENECKTMLETAVTEKKITVEEKNLLAEHYKGKPTELKALLATKKVFASITDNLNADVIPTDNQELNKLMAKTGDELFASGELAKIKTISLAAYQKKYKEWTGEDAPKEEEGK
jgi:hypothetical protein